MHFQHTPLIFIARGTISTSVSRIPSWNTTNKSNGWGQSSHWTRRSHTPLQTKLLPRATGASVEHCIVGVDGLLLLLERCQGLMVLCVSFVRCGKGSGSGAIGAIFWIVAWFRVFFQLVGQ